MYITQERARWAKFGPAISPGMHREAARKPILEFDNDGIASRIADLADLEAMIAMAVLFAHDDVLGDIGETASQIA